jgi:hypothetical protein
MGEIIELLVTCLECGEQWHYIVPTTLAAFFSLFTKTRPPIDQCPACGVQQAVFTQRDRGVSHTS